MNTQDSLADGNANAPPVFTKQLFIPPGYPFPSYKSFKTSKTG
jgi:hypothetical protein